MTRSHLSLLTAEMDDRALQRKAQQFEDIYQADRHFETEAGTIACLLRELLWERGERQLAAERMAAE